MRFSSLAVIASATLAKGVRLEARGAQSAATCQTSFAWMDNTKGVSPCQVASSVDALCNNGNWNIDALNPSISYQLPNAQNGTANLCTCSWANYNLLSACIACQGFPEQTPQWTVFISGCSADELSDTFFPTKLTLSSDVAIPKWAQQDPTQWTGEKFTAAQAQTIANKDLPDFIGGQSTATHKKTNVGAIVGGVIGGLVVVVGAIIAALWILRRQRQDAKAAGGSYEAHQPGHARSMSEFSTASNLKSTGGYASLSAMRPPTSPTVMTHNSSVRSVPYFSSVAGSTAPYETTSASPPPVPTRQGASTPTPGPDFIEPFTLPPTNDNPDRKQSNGGFPITVYDSPTAPPPNMMRMESARPQTPSTRGRYNPPAYTESQAGGSSSGQRQAHRGKQPSTDTLTSLTSSRNAHSPNTSGSGMPNIIEMGPPPPHEEHGRQVSTSRDEKRQPSQDTYNASDLA